MKKKDTDNEHTYTNHVKNTGTQQSLLLPKCGM